MINRTLKTCTTKEKSWNVWNEKYAKAFDLTTKTGPEKKWYVMKEKSFLHHKSCISKEKYFLTVCHTFYMTPKIQTVFHRFKKSYYLWPFHTGIYRKYFLYQKQNYIFEIWTILISFKHYIWVESKTKKYILCLTFHIKEKTRPNPFLGMIM